LGPRACLKAVEETGTKDKLLIVKNQIVPKLADFSDVLNLYKV